LEIGPPAGGLEFGISIIMEQIVAVFGINWKLLLIQAINFGILLVILHRFLYRPILRIIEERKKVIDEGLQNAETAKEELNHIELKRKEALKENLIKSELLIGEAKKRAEELEKEAAFEAETRSRKLMEEARELARGEKEKILKEAQSELARIAVLGAEKILREKSL